MSAPGDPQGQQQEELNVLFHAAQLGRTDIIKNAISSLREMNSPEDLLKLLSATRPEDGATLMHIGALAGHPDVIRALLNTGVDANIVPSSGDFAGKTPYEAAEPSVHQAFHVYLFEKIALGQEQVICNLLDSGIAVDLRDSSTVDDSTLHWACSFGNAPVAAALLDRGCPVNILNNIKQTPFHLACKNGSREVVDLLLANGTNAMLLDDQGRSAMDLIPSKYSDPLAGIINAHVAEHPSQHDAPPPTSTADTSSTAAEPDTSSHRSMPSESQPHSTTVDNNSYSGSKSTGSVNQDMNAPSGLRPPPMSNRLMSDVTSHLILWPPPQRQRMLPMSAFEGGGADGASSAPEYGIVFSSIRPVLISFSTDNKSDMDINCIAEVCGLTQALKRFGLECVVLRSPASADIRFSVNTSLCPGHHRYSVNVCPSFISVIGSDREGLLYGAYTLVQIAQLHSEFGVLENDSESLDQSRDGLEFNINGYGPSDTHRPADVIRTLTIPCVSIEDWPDFPSRGITWSYDAAALTNIATLHNTIAMLSRLRINKLFMLVDCLDHSTTPEHSESALSQRHRDTVLCGSRVYYVEQVCRRYLVDVVPVVKVPCYNPDLSTTGNNNQSHSRLNVDALRCFSSPVIHMEFSSDAPSGSTGVGVGGIEGIEDCSADVVRSCRLALKCVRAAGFTSVVVRCTSVFQRLYDPLSVAAHVGLLGVYGDIDSFTDEEDPMHMLSSHVDIKEAELRCRCDFEQGKTLSIGPGFVENAILYPMILVKYKCFLHSGFCWNHETVLDIIGTSSDIQMLEEVLNLIILDGNGGTLRATSEGGARDNESSSPPARGVDGLHKTGSSGGLSSMAPANGLATQDAAPTEASSGGGFLFWRKQASSDPLANSANFSNHGGVSTMTHLDFLIALMTCSSGAIFEPPRGSGDVSEAGGHRENTPIFEFVEAGTGLGSPTYKSPSRAMSSTPTYRPPGLLSGSMSFTEQGQRQGPTGNTFPESESLFWRFLSAKSFGEFVTCGNTRACESDGSNVVDGFAPSKGQALEVLKYYRRALSSVGWKLDRKKMAVLREQGMSGENSGTRAQWGAEIHTNEHGHAVDGDTETFVFDNSSTKDDFPFPNYRDADWWGNPRAASKRFQKDEKRESPFMVSSSPSAAGDNRGDELQLNIEEIYVALHLVCTMCRAIILGYNAYEKVHPGQEARLLKFSELVAILPTGSTSDVANALLEGIEYGMMLWNRRFERLSFKVRRGKNSEKRKQSLKMTEKGDISPGRGPAIPGIGAFYWISQNLPQQVEDLFFNTLTMLQRYS